MNDDMYEKLERLAALRDRGILSEDEFTAQKALLLGAGGPSPIAAQPTPLPAPPVASTVATAAPPVEARRAPPAPKPAPSDTPPRNKQHVGSVAFIVILSFLLPCGGLIVYSDYESEKARQEAEAQAARDREAALAAQLAEERALRETPRIALTVSRCDDSCSSMFEDCMFVECVAQNVGEVSIEGTIELAAGKHTKPKDFLLGAGSEERLSAKFKGVSAKQCECRAAEVHRFVH